MDAEKFIANFLNEDHLIHYASKYYDPVKAKEYYERTKELKGRQSSGELTKEQRQRQTEATSYARNQISTERKAALEKFSEEQKAALEKMRDDAKAVRDRIKAKLKKFIPKVLEEGVNLLSLEEEYKPQPIPKNASPALRRFIEKQNAILLDQTRDRVNSENKKTRERVTAENKKNREKVTAENKKVREERKRVGTELQSAITKARETYTANRKALVEKYSTLMDTELQNIRDNVR